MNMDDLSSPVSERINITISTSTTPTTQSGENSPTRLQSDGNDGRTTSGQKKKKKKKSKKPGKPKDASTTLNGKSSDLTELAARPPVLCISRNKHWRYISSYHGPWLQLPLELLESLLILNLDPATLSAPDTRLLPQSSNAPPSVNRQRDRPFHTLGEQSPPNSPRSPFSSMPLPPAFPSPPPGQVTPPPIDPGVFRSVTSIRRLIDEAAELSVRASSGLSAAELGSMRSGPGLGNSPWAAAQSLGINLLGNANGGGRNVAMSAMRIHRLRALAVQKLAQAYKADEIASSVMVMQGGSVFDDVAERVLKHDPTDLDARYVHFFHEKIPSRQLAESTTTKVLDELIAAQPQRLEYYRTRGIVHCFRDEYTQATKDFTHALREARAVRRAKASRHSGSFQNETYSAKSKRRRKANKQGHGQAPSDGTGQPSENGLDGSDVDSPPLHPSVLPDAPDPIEPQLLFLRGAAYLQHAVHLIESAVLNLEGIGKIPSVDGAELRLCYLENGKYGGVEIGNPDGPLGRKDGPKVAAYQSVLGEKAIRDQITNLLKKSIRDHEKFLSHFDSVETPDCFPDGDIAFQTEYAFILSESLRPGSSSTTPPPPHTASAVFTTYHPLLVESHFSILICMLMLADFAALLPAFVRTATLVDGLEGYPVFLPPRSMGQAEFVEVLERLAGGWKHGIQPHSLTAQRGKERLAIEPSSPTRAVSPVEGTYNSDDTGNTTRASSSASTSRKNSAVFGESSSMPRISPSPLSINGSQFFARADGAHALDCARILLAPVVKRQRERAEKAALDKSGNGNGSKKSPMSISIPLHGPRVEVILAWLGAVHLPELEMF